MTKIVHKHSPRQTRHSFVCPSDQPSSKREENMRKVRRNMIVTAKYRSRTVGYPCPGTDGRGVEVKFYFIHSSSLRPQTASHPAQTFSSEGRLPTTTFGGKRSWNKTKKKKRNKNVRAKHKATPCGHRGLEFMLTGSDIVRAHCTPFLSMSLMRTGYRSNRPGQPFLSLWMERTDTQQAGYVRGCRFTLIRLEMLLMLRVY